MATRSLRLLLTLACLLPVSAITGAVEANAQAPTLDIVSIGDASVSAQGLLLTVPVTITCSEEEEFASINVEIRQRVGQQIARGFAFIGVDLICDSAPHTYLVTVEAFDRPFRPGQGLARAQASACYDGVGFFCIFDDTGLVEIRLRHG